MSAESPTIVVLDGYGRDLRRLADWSAIDPAAAARDFHEPLVGVPST